MLESAIANARPTQGNPRPWTETTQRQRLSAATKPATVPAIDLRFTSPIPQTRIFCLPMKDPMISENASPAMYDPQIIAKTGANSLGRKTAASFIPMGTMMNLKALQRVVISRQLARASTPSITRDCGP